MLRILKKIAYLFFVPLIAIFFLLSPVFVSEGATMNSAYIMLSRMAANLDATSNLDIYIGFETSQPFATGGTLTLEFPDTEDGNWCRTAGTGLTVSGITTTPADSADDYIIDAALPGTLSASCTQGSGSGSVDTITVTGLTALSSNTTYGVKISNGTTPKLGTGTADTHLVNLTVTQDATIDTVTFGLNIVSDDQVTISAQVVNPPTITCSLNSNSVNLGNLYRGGSYVIGSHTISTSTSDNSAGYYWVAYGQGDGSTNAGLYKSTATTYLIASDNSSSTVDISYPGSEGFGMNVEVPSGEAVAGTGFGDNSPGVFGSLGMGVDNAELIAYRNWGPQTSILDSTITYGARAGDGAQAGAYSETVTFVCGGYIGGYAAEPEMSLLSSPTTTTSDSTSGGTSTWSEPENAQEDDGTFTYSLAGDGGTCLAQETLIWTESGNVPISEIEIGDMVYSYNLDTQVVELSEVGNVWSSPITDAQSKYYNIYYGDTYVRATYNHRFFVNGEYILAEELMVGDYLLDVNNQKQRITDINIEENSTDSVWDLSVNDNHNFFANGVLVHNQGVYDDKIRLVKGGAIGSTDRASSTAWSSNITQTVYGGPTDLWGETWTPADLNSTDFGVAISTYGTGYTTNNITEYLKTTNFGLNIPTSAVIQGIELRVRRRLRVDGSSVYSDIDFVKVKVYYEDVPWTLNFNDIDVYETSIGETNTESIPENVTLYLEYTVTSGSISSVEERKNTVLSTWSNNTTKTYNAGDNLSILIDIGGASSAAGSVVLYEDNQSGRIISDFTFNISTGPGSPPPVSPIE